jgi:hypothetical protein
MLAMFGDAHGSCRNLCSSAFLWMAALRNRELFLLELTCFSLGEVLLLPLGLQATEEMHGLSRASAHQFLYFWSGSGRGDCSREDHISRCA